MIVFAFVRLWHNPHGIEERDMSIVLRKYSEYGRINRMSRCGEVVFRPLRTFSLFRCVT